MLPLPKKGELNSIQYGTGWYEADRLIIIGILKYISLDISVIYPKSVTSRKIQFPEKRMLSYNNHK